MSYDHQQHVSFQVNVLARCLLVYTQTSQGRRLGLLNGLLFSLRQRITPSMPCRICSLIKHMCIEYQCSWHANLTCCQQLTLLVFDPLNKAPKHGTKLS
jgi:hypothetical protein